MINFIFCCYFQIMLIFWYILTNFKHNDKILAFDFGIY